MTDSNARDRSLLLAAFQREGITYPADRLNEAVEEFSLIQGFLALIRDELRASEEQRHA